MKFIYTLIISLILSLSTLNATQKQTDNIANISAASLYNIDKTSLQNTITAYIKNHPNIKALKITEALSEEIYVSIYRDKDGKLQEGVLPSKLEKYRQYQSIAKFEGEKVGEIITYYKSKELIKLTEKEKQWLKKNSIVLSVDDQYAPMNFKNSENEMDGLSIDYIKLIEKKIGYPIQLDSHPWPVALDNAMKHKTDGIINANYTQERAQKLLFTDSYISVPMLLITSHNSKAYDDLSQLKNKTILVKEKTVEATILPQKYPSLKVQTVKNYKDALVFVSTGKADGVFGHMAVLEYSNNQYLLPNLKKNFVSFGDMITKQAIGIKKSEPLLRDILNKAIKAISIEEKQAINNKWMKPIEENETKLTFKEIAWLKQNPPITLAVVDNYPPYDFRDENNQLSGFHTDITNLINKNLGLSIRLKAFKSWTEAYNSVLNNSTDGIYSLSWSREREEKYFNYSSPYHFSPYHLVVNGNNNISLEEISGQTIAVEKDTIFKNIIETKAPNAKLLLVENTKEAYASVKSGKAFATISPNIKDSLFKSSGLNVASEVYDKSSNLYVGTNKKNAIVSSIIAKGINSISLKDITRLRYKWFEKNKALISLSNVEKKWLRNNPTIKVIEFFNEPPFTINGVTKKSGYMYELLEEMARLGGLEIDYIGGFDSFSSMVDSLGKGNVDIQPTFLAKMPLSKDSTIKKTKTILSTPFVVIGRSDSPIYKTIDDLKGKRVAVVKGYAQDRHLSQVEGVIKVHVKHNDEGFKVLREGKADYYINNNANSQYIIAKSFSNDIKVLDTLPYSVFPPLEFVMGLNGKKPQLVSILNKALDQISVKKIQEIRNRWILETHGVKDLSQKVKLSAKEKAFIQKHPNIVFGADQNWRPFDFRDKFSKHAGFNADFLELIREKTGLDIKVKLGKWGDLQNQVKNRELAGLVGPTKTEQRLEYMNFTESYFTISQVVLSRNNVSEIGSLNELNDKTVAIKSGSSNIEFIKKNYPEITVKIYNNTSEIIRALSFNEIDYAISNIGAASYESKRNFVSNIKVIYDISELSGDMHFGIRKDWPELVSIIQKGIEAVDREEINKILTQWLSLAPSSNTTLSSLTKEEQAFITKHPKIRIHNEEAWAPFNFYEKGRARGLSIDYIKALFNKVGIEPEFITGPSWNEFIEMSKSKEIDLMLNIAKSPEREKFLHFTNAYAEIIQSVFIKEGSAPISKIEDLFGKTFAVPKGFYYEEVLKKYPQIKLLKLKDTLECIQAVSSGKAYAMLDLITVVNYYKNKYNFKNIVLGGTLGIEGGSLPLHLGVRKDWPELASILNKSLSALNDEEINKIEAKWLFNNNRVKQSLVDLTSEEKKWIQQNKVSIGVEEWAPVIFSHGGRNYDGITGDILRLIIERTGLKFNVINDTWDILLDKFKKKEIDLLPATYYTDERATYGLYSDGYYKMLDYIYVREENQTIKSLEDIKGKTLAIPKDFGTIPKIKKNFPEITIIETRDQSDSIQRVLRGEVDALYDGQIAIEYRMQEDLVVGLKGIPQKSFNAAPLYMFSHIDKPILRDILNKALRSIPPYEINRIKSKWLLEKRHERITNSVNTRKTNEDAISILMISVGIFLFLLLILILITKFISDDFVAKSFGSSKFRTIALIILSIVIFLLAALVQITLSENKKNNLASTKGDLEFVLKSTQDRLDTWIKERKNFLIQMGRDQKLIDTTKALLTVNKDASSLRESSELKDMRAYFKNREEEFGNLGFFIIDKNYISIGSRRDTNLGTKNLIAKNNVKLLEKVFAGEAVFIPPMVTDVNIKDEKNPNEHTMFFAIPIQDNNGEVIAAMTQRLDVEGKFSEIIHSGRIGMTGESYLFSKDGFMLTKSRFRNELIKIGLLNEGEKEYDKLQLKNPGGNLLEGYKPTISVDSMPLTTMAQSAISLDKTAIGSYSKIYSNIEGYKDYRGVEVFGAWLWYKKYGLGITTELDESEALREFYTLKQNLFIITGLTLLLTVMAVIMLIILGEKATRSIQKANNDLNKLLESFDDNVIASKTDAKGIIKYASKAFCRISGYTEEELIGSPQSIVRHPDMPKTLFENLWKTIQNGKKWQGEVKNKTKNGGFYWVDVVIEPEFDEEQNIVGFSAIRQDITSKKEVEELSENLEIKVEERTKELDENVKFMNTLIENLPTAVFAKDVNNDFRFITWNKYSEELFGMKAEEVIGKNDFDFFSNEEAAYFLKTDQEVISKNEITEIPEETITTAKGDRILNTLKIGIPDENGKPNILLGISIDITEQKKAQQTIIEQQQQFSSMAANVPGVIYRCKVDAGWTMLYISNEIEVLSGYPVSDFINNSVRSFADIMHEDDIEPVATLIQNQIDKGEKFLVDYRVIDKDGTVKWVRSQGQAYMTDDNDQWLDGVLFDVTEQKKLEEEVKESQKRFATIFDAAPDSILLMKDGEYISCNQKTLEIFGVESEDIFRQSKPSDYSPKMQECGNSSVELASAKIQKAMETGYNRFEWIHKRIDTNENFDAEVILSSIMLGGEPHIYAVIRDITQRKELERIIKENTEQMTYVSQHANLGFWNFNPQIGDLFVNDVFVEMLGYDAKEVLLEGYEDKMFKPFKDGLAFWEQLLHPDDAERTGEIITAHINGETDLYNVEYRMRRADGSWMWSRAVGRISVFDDDGKPIRFNGVNIDIDEAKRAQELIEDQKQYTDSIMNSQSNIVISTDGEKLRTANKSFLDFFEVKNEQEFLDNIGDCICDTFDKDAPDEFLQKMMGEEKWIEYVYARPDMIHKARIERHGEMHIFTITSDRFEFAGEMLEVAVFTDITEIEAIRKNIETILSNIMLPVLITSKETRTILYANEYASIQYEAPIEKLVGSSIDNVYTSLEQKDQILSIMKEQGYVENLEEKYRTRTGREFVGLLSVKPIVYNHQEAFIGMVVDITQQKDIEAEIREIHKHTQSSIEYASLIQHSLIPSNDLFRKYYDDYFTIWHPKDIVGGDIYLFDELRDDNECLLMVIDCTGHGVPGAFVTMLVKAIERQVAAIIASDPTLDVSPAWILQYFNQTMKKLLKQEDENAISNAGFDGAVLYYNRSEQIIRFAGAELPLFYIEDGEFKTIKGNRHSIGYKKSDANYEFKEHIIEAKEGMQFYLTSDGYLDQNGGEKGFPFGKKRFLSILEEYKDYSFADQQEVLLNELQTYQKDEERNDDISIVGVKIGKFNKKTDDNESWVI